MRKITLISALLASMISISSAEMFGGVISDMMDIPKEIITSGTDAIKDMKDAAKDSVDSVKDSVTDLKDDIKDKVTDEDAEKKEEPKKEEPKVEESKTTTK